jgi:hypothetical protein
MEVIDLSLLSSDSEDEQAEVTYSDNEVQREMYKEAYGSEPENDSDCEIVDVILPISEDDTACNFERSIHLKMEDFETGTL